VGIGFRGAHPVLFPLFGLHLPLASNLVIGAIVTVVSHAPSCTRRMPAAREAVPEPHFPEPGHSPGA